MGKGNRNRPRSTRRFDGDLSGTRGRFDGTDEHGIRCPLHTENIVRLHSLGYWQGEPAWFSCTGAFQEANPATFINFPAERALPIPACDKKVRDQFLSIAGQAKLRKIIEADPDY